MARNPKRSISFEDAGRTFIGEVYSSGGKTVIKIPFGSEVSADWLAYRLANKRVQI